MKIIMHIDNLGAGGAQKQIVVLAQALTKKGHEVAFNTYYPQDFFQFGIEELGIEVRTFTKSHKLSLQPAYHLVRHAREFGADVIVAFMRTPAIYAELANIFLPNCRVIVSERESFKGSSISTGLKVSQQFHRLADFVTVNSAHQCERMVREFPWLKAKTRLIRNGYELGEAKNRDGRIDGNLKLLALASIIPEKDPMSLAKALLICRNERKIPLEINWAGRTSIDNGVCAAKVETDEFLNANGMNIHWKWLGLRKDTDELIARCDALIHPSKAEGYANAIAESLVSGTPVLIGRVGDQPKLVSHSEAGLVFNTGDPKSMADAISKFYHMSDDQRKLMGISGRKYAEEHLSVTKMADEYEALMRQLTGVK